MTAQEKQLVGSTYYQKIIHRDSVTDFIMQVKAFGGRIADSHRIGFDHLIVGYKFYNKH